MLLIGTAIGAASLLPASEAAVSPKKWRGTVLISAKYDKPGYFDDRDYFTYTAKAVFDGRGTRITKRGTMTWTFDGGTRVSADPQRSLPCTWKGSGTTPVTAEIYKADPEDGTRNLAVVLHLQHQPKFGFVTEACWGWDNGTQSYTWLTKQVDAWQAVRGVPGTLLVLPVKTTSFKRTVRPWFPFLDNSRAARATVVVKFALK